MATSLTFQNKTISVINQQNQIWMTIPEIGNALGYNNPVKGITKLYNAHSEEFSPNMTALIDMRTNGGMQKVRIFSLRGCHLIGMLSHTKVAKDFRKWVLDILDKEIERQQQPQQLALPQPPEESKRTVHWKWQNIRTISWLWFSHGKMLEHLAELLPALERLESKYATRTYSQVQEYKSLFRESTPLIAELLEDCPMDSLNRHSLNRVLQELKNLESETKRKALQRLKGF